jgi:Ca-activated chloride channel family protein
MLNKPVNTAPVFFKRWDDRIFRLTLARVFAASLLCLLAIPQDARAGPGWTGLWLTPDQQGQRLFQRGEFSRAAQTFNDPMWQGTAWYRAGEFEKAAQAFARLDTAEARFNQGNAWLLRGQYETAITWYERALEQRPEWQEAIENRALAGARAKLTERKGGEMGDQKIGADEIVFNQNSKEGGQDTELEGGEALTDQQIQALWLRRVQTRPSDFLRARFSFQLAREAESSQ